jgi:hypothetical protein
MTRLNNIVANNTRTLREETILPALKAALEADEQGLSFEFIERKAVVNNKRCAVAVECRVKQRRKTKAVGA